MPDFHFEFFVTGVYISVVSFKVLQSDIVATYSLEKTNNLCASLVEVGISWPGRLIIKKKKFIS